MHHVRRSHTVVSRDGVHNLFIFKRLLGAHSVLAGISQISQTIGLECGNGRCLGDMYISDIDGPPQEVAAIYYIHIKREASAALLVSSNPGNARAPARGNGQ